VESVSCFCFLFWAPPLQVLGLILEPAQPSSSIYIIGISRHSLELRKRQEIKMPAMRNKTRRAKEGGGLN